MIFNKGPCHIGLIVGRAEVQAVWISPDAPLFAVTHQICATGDMHYRTISIKRLEFGVIYNTKRKYNRPDFIWTVPDGRYDR